MSIDLWLLEQYQQGLHPPCLRFYTWSEPTISLGYHQTCYPTDWADITWQGKKLSLVRRPSGGRAVLHQGDLTYAVITSDLPHQRREAYCTICQFLIDGWRELGLDLEYGNAAPRSYLDQASCFATATSADLVTPRGDKLIGSAQLRRKETILQHGAILYSTDGELLERVFGADRPQSNLRDYLQLTDLDLFEKVIPTLTAAARHCFGVELQEKPLTEAEWAEITAKLVDFPELV
jgi:lipoate---protein ligase